MFSPRERECFPPLPQAGHWRGSGRRHEKKSMKRRLKTLGASKGLAFVEALREASSCTSGG